MNSRLNILDLKDGREVAYSNDHNRDEVTMADSRSA